MTVVSVNASSVSRVLNLARLQATVKQLDTRVWVDDSNDGDMTAAYNHLHDEGYILGKLETYNDHSGARRNGFGVMGRETDKRMSVKAVQEVLYKNGMRGMPLVGRDSNGTLVVRAEGGYAESVLTAAARILREDGYDARISQVTSAAGTRFELMVFGHGHAPVRSSSMRWMR